MRARRTLSILRIADAGTVHASVSERDAQGSCLAESTGAPRLDGADHSPRGGNGENPLRKDSAAVRSARPTGGSETDTVSLVDGETRARTAPPLRGLDPGDGVGGDGRALRGGGPRTPRAHLPRRGPSLRARRSRRSRAGFGDAVRGAPRRRAGMAPRRRAPAERHPHEAPRAAGPAGVRVVPGRRTPAAALHPRHRRASGGLRGRRPLGPVAAAAGREGAVARLSAAARRPGLRRRGLARDPRLHPQPPRRLAASRRRGRRLRGVHAPLPGVLERSRHPLAALDRAEHHDLRRSRRSRRLEHLRRLGAGDAGEALVGGADRRRLHGVLALSAPR